MTNYVNIRKHKVYQGVQFHTKHKMFDNKELIVEIHEDKILFKIVTIDTTTKYFKTCKLQFGWKSLNHTHFYIEKGKYMIDEDETNEDQLVIYLEDKV